MDFQSWQQSAQHLSCQESRIFVRSHGLESAFPEINEASPTELVIYPGALVITTRNGRYSVTIGDVTLNSHSRRKLERMLFFYGIEHGRLAA